MKHWKPPEEIAEIAESARAIPVRQRQSLPPGAKAGLFAVAVGCIGIAALLYRVAGPRDVFH